MKKIILLLTSVIITTACYSQTLVAWYPFTGGAANDQSPNALNGTLVGGPVPTSGAGTAGPSTALQFNGTGGQYVQVPYSSLLDLPKWTIMAQVKFNTFTTGGCNRSIIAERGTTADPDYIDFEVSNFCNALPSYNAYGLAGQGPYPAMSSYPPMPPLNPNVWYCISVAYDGSTISVYVGGALMYTKPMAAYSLSGSTPILYIGQYLDGAIDDIQIYANALTPGQITTMACSAPSITGSTGNEWLLAGNHVTASDYIGTNNHFDFVIKTDSLERGRVTADGNWEFGTNNFTGSVVSGATGTGNVTNSSANSFEIGASNFIDNSANSVIAGEQDTIINGSLQDGIVGKRNRIDHASNSMNMGYLNTIVRTPGYQYAVTENMNMGAGNHITNSGQSMAIGEGNQLDSSTFASLAAGGGNKIKTGSTSLAFGSGNTLTSTSASQASGSGNALTGSQASMAFGGGNTVTGSQNVQATGLANIINSSSYSVASGTTNTLTGSQGSTASGTGNQITASQNSANSGASNIISNAVSSMNNGASNSISLQNNAFTAGAYNVISNTNGSNGTSCVSLGQDNQIHNSFASGITGTGNTVDNGLGSIALGTGVHATGSNVHVYGEQMANTLPHSIAMGFNNRTMTVTQTGVGISVSNLPNYGPTHHLEVDALVPGNPLNSNIAFFNLPLATQPVSSVVIDRFTGELFYSPNVPVNYIGNQGVTLSGNAFQLGNVCGQAQSIFTVNREIALNNRNLYFNTNDIGKMFIGRQACPQLTTRLEISTQGIGSVSNGYATGIPSPSGLRFTDMTMQTQLATNQSQGVLSLDAEGDVIWVRDQTGTGGAPLAANEGCSVDITGTFVQLGQDCSSPGTNAQLTGDRAIPMNDHNIIFRDGPLQPMGNRIGIGPSACTPGAKFEVIRSLEPGAGYDPLNRAIAGINNDFSPISGTGVYGEANAPQNADNFGGDFLGKAGHNATYGVRGAGLATGGNFAYGGYFSACNAQTNIGVYGTACNSSNKGAGPSFAGLFNGDVSATYYFQSSDRKIKKNITPIANAMDLLNRIEPKKYEYRTDEFPALNLPTAKDNYGVIAQELEEVLPSLVREAAIPGGDKASGKETIKSVNYTELIPILIQAVKDQQKQIDALTAKLDNTAKQQSEQDKAVSHLDIMLSDKDIAVLDQNYPNPFDKYTAIGYYIPAGVHTAVLQFASVEGRVVKAMEVPTRGKGIINVYTPELNTGTYTYTLIADGKVIDTRKMQIIR